MESDAILELLRRVSSGDIDPEQASRELAHLPFASIDSAHIDHHRSMRCGFPEVVFCQGKTPSQVRSIAREILDHGDVLLATRATSAHYQAAAQVAPDARYHETARLIVADRRENPSREGNVVVATGGTADSPVADEAAICAEVMGNRVTRLYDVGVAGIHRLLSYHETLREARVIIAVAGMEGALPSVVAGLVDVPVVAVPTSVGYGAHLGGIAPLLTMLNTCASGIGVVNIDNGFGAAALASRINLGPELERGAK